MRDKAPLLAIVVPCYNEEEVLKTTHARLSEILINLINLKKISDDSFIVFVDDGSKDLTWSIIKDISTKDKMIKGVKLSKNQGHQNALIAGMEYVNNKCDCLISIDADLQDDINVISEMIDKYIDGAEVVYASRKDRATDTFFKKMSAELFYKLMLFLGVNLVYNHADFRLLGARAMDSFLKFNERNMFIRGVIPLVGFRSETIYYTRLERFAGESKYPLKKMLAFAWDGITSFSVAPLRLVSAVGFLIFLSSLVMGGACYIQRFLLITPCKAGLQRFCRYIL